MLRPIARRCRLHHHNFCQYHLSVQQEALFLSMKSREEVSLSPLRYRRAQIYRLDSGHMNRSGDMLSLRCMPCRSFKRFLYIRWAIFSCQSAWRKTFLHLSRTFQPFCLPISSNSIYFFFDSLLSHVEDEKKYGNRLSHRFRFFLPESFAAFSSPK